MFDRSSEPSLLSMPTLMSTAFMFFVMFDISVCRSELSAPPIDSPPAPMLPYLPVTSMVMACFALSSSPSADNWFCTFYYQCCFRVSNRRASFRNRS